MVCALASISASERPQMMPPKKGSHSKSYSHRQKFFGERAKPGGEYVVGEDMKNHRDRHWKKMANYDPRQPVTNMLVKELHTKVPKLDGKDDDPTLQSVYNGWFSPSGRELMPNSSYLGAVLQNVTDKAKDMQRSAEKVIKKADIRAEGSHWLTDSLKDQALVANTVERKELNDILKVDRDRMKWVNHMLDSDHKGLPSNENLLDYVKAIEALEEDHLPAGEKAKLAQGALGKQLLFDAENAKAPYKDLLFPHTITVSRRAYGAVGTYDKHMSVAANTAVTKLRAASRNDYERTDKNEMMRLRVAAAEGNGASRSRVAADSEASADM